VATSLPTVGHPDFRVFKRARSEANRALLAILVALRLGRYELDRLPKSQANALLGEYYEHEIADIGHFNYRASQAVATDNGPVEVALSPDAKSVYVTNLDSRTVSQYDINPLTGTLTPKTPASVAAGISPSGIGCAPNRFASSAATVCRATVTDTAGSGQTTPTGTVSFTTSGTGTFYGSPCTLSGSGASASCAVLFTSFPRGGRIIGAGYGGDGTHSASSGFTGVSVAVPASTAGCVVFGHGRITAANGDKASFRGLVAASPPRGVEFYRDNGPVSAIRVVSTSVDALTCNPDATRTSVFGTATVNGAGPVEYRIDVQLTAWEWGKDTYRIRLSSGYDSGAQQIRHGDVDIHLRSSEHHHQDANADRYKPGAGPDGG
jgi:hypothetical protein